MTTQDAPLPWLETEMMLARSKDKNVGPPANDGGCFESKYNIPNPALFLDRDVLIEDKHYLCDPNEVSLCPGSRELVQAAHEMKWAIVVITNQSGIARGFFGWSDYERVTDRLLKLLGASAPLAGIYANGHGPDAPAGSWRKPSPAMLLEASWELNPDLNHSLLIGDRLSDLEAGARSGVQRVDPCADRTWTERAGSIKAWATRQPSGFNRTQT